MDVAREERISAYERASAIQRELDNMTSPVFLADLVAQILRIEKKLDALLKVNDDPL